MNWATAVVLIVLITALAGVMRHRSQSSQRMDLQDGTQNIERERQLEEEIEQLRDRIQVLERIATEGNSVNARETQRVAAEIEALRDAQDK